MLIYDPGIPLLRMKTYVNQRHVQEHSFVALFIISTLETIQMSVRKIIFIEYLVYSNQSKLLFFATIRIHLTGTILNKRSQTVSDSI